MVSRTPQHVDMVSARRQGTEPSGGQKDGKAVGTPRHPKKESSTPKPAQDAELKDYV